MTPNEREGICKKNLLWMLNTEYNKWAPIKAIEV